MNINLKRACANCPFKKVGAIELRPGRLEGIVSDLIANDTAPFLCHKTVYAKGNEGEVIVDEEGNEECAPGQKSSICAGSMVYLRKIGQPNVAMRMGFALGLLTVDELDAQRDEIIDPEDLVVEAPSRSKRKTKTENAS